MAESNVLHCVIITCLYFSQGLAKGTVIVTPLLLLQRFPLFSTSDIATLGIPMYSFTLKFLWAPVVDRVYYRHRSSHQRQRGSEDHSEEEEEEEEMQARKKASVGSSRSLAACALCNKSTRLVRRWLLRFFSVFLERVPWLHRRAQWVIGLQLLLASGYFFVACDGADALFEDATHHRGRLFELWWVLFVLTVGCATQDVAIDAWAVEGLPLKCTEIPGSLQLGGTIGGILTCYIFIQMNGAYPHVCTISAFVIGCGCACVGSAVLAALLAVRRPLKAAASTVAISAECAESTGAGSMATVHTSDGETAYGMKLHITMRKAGSHACVALSPSPPPPQKHVSMGIRGAMGELLRTHGLREILTIFLTRGWPVAAYGLVEPRLIALKVLKASDVAFYRTFAMLVQLAVGSLAAPRLLEKVHPARVLRGVSGCEFVLSSISCGCFIFIASPSTGRWYGPAIAFPLFLCFASVGSFSFVGNMAVASTVARRFPQDAGTVLTLLNAIGNLGYTLPDSLCLYASDVVVGLTSALAGRSTGYAALTVRANDQGVTAPVANATHVVSTVPSSVFTAAGAPPVSIWLVKMDVIVCSLVVLSAAAIARYRLLIPAANLLCVNGSSTALDDEESLSKIL